MTQDDFNRVIRYVTVIFRGLFVAFAVFALTVLGGAWVINNVEKVYTATAVIEIMAKPDVAGSPAHQPGARTVLEQNIQAILSPGMLGNVVDDLDLDKVWPERFLKSKQRLTRDQAVGHLLGMLKVKMRPDSDLVEISAASDLPKEAADIANAVAESYKRARDQAEKEREDTQDPQKQAARKRGETAPGEIEGTLAFTSVRIVSRAAEPVQPTRPDRGFDMMLVYILAAFLSIGIGSSVEVVFLLLRAAERPES